MSEKERKIETSDSEVGVDAVVSRDCERQIESDFVKALTGIIETHNISKPYLKTNYLKAAYDTGKAQELSENLILKYCCVVLSKIINDDITEKYFKASNSG